VKRRTDRVGRAICGLPFTLEASGSYFENKLITRLPSTGSRIGNLVKSADVHGIDELRAARQAAVVRDDDDEEEGTCGKVGNKIVGGRNDRCAGC
jgi:hypothetical protein